MYKCKIINSNYNNKINKEILYNNKYILHLILQSL